MKFSKRILFVLAIVMMAITVNAQSNNYVNHTVAKGETLYSISKRYNTTVEEVVKLNPGSERILSIGQKLIIPRNTANKVKSGKTHLIQPGETLYRLSKMYNVTIEEICDVNPGLSKNNFRAGEEIIIPTKQATQKQEEQKVAVSVEPETEKEQTIIGTHKVKRKDNIESICEKYNITKEELIRANPILKEKKMKRKMVLNIPAPSTDSKNVYIEEETIEKEEEKEVEEKKEEPKQEEEEATKEDVTGEQEITGEEQVAGEQEVTDEEQVAGEEETTIEEEGFVYEDEKALSEEEIIDNSYVEIDIVEIDEDKLYPGAFNKDNVVNVAFVMSFLLDRHAPNEQERLVEYYQGFLMAVEQLKREGHSFVINTFDAGHKDASLDSLLRSGALDDAEIIIGATYAKHNKELAKFAKDNRKPLIIPLATKKDEAIDNPMVYIANGIQQYILPEVSKGFVSTFQNAKVLFVEDEKSDKKEFIKILTAQLEKNKIPYTTLPLKTLTNPKKIIPALSKVKQKKKELIIIPTSSSAATLKSLLPALLEAKNTDSTKIGKFKLFGYPEWQIYANDTREMLYEADTHIYATFYSHYSLPRVAKFLEEYLRWYNTPIKNVYPRYSMMGYDTGYFFLRAASLYKNDMPERINETQFTPVQSDFMMERISESDGFINSRFFFIHYCPEYRIEKINFIKEKAK